jgi:hypothetical protein
VPTRDVDCLKALRRAGWSLGDTAFRFPAGGLVWLVSGVNGKNRIRAEGSTCAAAWRAAVEQAKAVGMIGCGGR